MDERDNFTHLRSRLDNSPYHKDPACDLHSNSDGAASNPAKGRVENFKQSTGLGQDYPRAEVLVDVRSSKVSSELR